MKKAASLFIAIIIALSSLPVCAFAAGGDNVLVSKSIPCTIVIPAASTGTERYAAETMKKYVKEITDADVSILSDASEKSGNEIVIGNTARKAIDVSSLSDGSYKIQTDDSCLYISGSGNRGNIYGVYGFLEKFCNCRWYTSKLKVIPTSESISLADSIDYTYKPYFEYTETDWRSPHNSEYSLANGLNGNTYRNLSAAQGGTVGYLTGAAHTLTNQFCTADKYFESHPEYFALRDGKRVKDQLCLTNPDVLKIVTDEVLELLSQRSDPSKSMQIVSLTQNDNCNYCTCDNCKALDDANGSQSGTMITFVNSVARAVKAAGYTNVLIDTFAYQYTRKAPTNVVPDDNVIVRLCSIECCFGHTLNDPDCNSNADFMYDLEQWGKICNRIYIWDYTTNYLETLCIFPDFGVLQQNMQTFYENNAKGIYEEGNYYIDSCDGEFGELRSYLLSKLMQDPYMDYDAEMNGFLKAYYGDGWQNIREFIDLTTEKGVIKNKHLSIYQQSDKALPGFTCKDIAHCNELWANAKSAAKTPEQYANVERSEICWRYWKCNNYKSEFSPFTTTLYQRMCARDQLYNDFLRLGINRMGERVTRPLSDCPTLHLLRRAEKWSKLYDEKFWYFIAPAVVYIFNVMKAVHNVFR
jgi:hypothetical protein